MSSSAHQPKLSVHLFALIASLVILLFPACKQNELRDEGAIMAREAAAWLWEQQQEDGGWHSELHGLLKIGQAYTPFVLDALLAVPDSIYKAKQEDVGRALDFIRKHCNEAGVLGLHDPDLLEYPNYSTAFALQCLVKTNFKQDWHLRENMANYLVSEQFDQDRGYDTAHVVFGGWGFGEEHLSPGNPGHVDLSHTRRILEALQMAEFLDAGTRGKATIFARRLQKDPEATGRFAGSAPDSLNEIYDGGFYYTPVIPDANKGRTETTGDTSWYRSYATATCDGLLSMLALGMRPDSKPVRAGMAWLKAHPSWEYPQGIPEDHPNQWHRVMFFYHISVRAQLYGKIRPEGDWREEMLSLLSERKNEDGSFANPDGAPNKENDPILATTMVLKGLIATLPQPPKGP